jgi:pSer/pThr/pTyr-binding forkhead associated (FHA) protein
MPILHVLEGVNAGQVIQFDSDLLILGRDPDCHLVIPVPSANRKHAQILRLQERYFLEDRQSRSGTYLNSKVITARQPLRNNDRIRIGDFVAAFISDDDPAHPSAQEMVEVLAAGPADAERKDIQVVYALGSSVDEECRRLRVALEVNHVFYDLAESNGLHQELTARQSHARGILAAGFHRLVVLDAQRGLDLAGSFDIDRFLRHVHDELVQAFDLHLTVNTYHLENIAQVLKDEPRSLFCFLNLQHVPLEDLGRLRGFAQELHQALFLCRGPRELGQAQDLLVEELDSGMALLVEEWSKGGSAETLRGLLEVANNLNKTLDLDALLPKIAENLFGFYRQADRCFIIQAEEGTRKLMPRVVKTRRPQDEHNARPSRTIVQRCLDTAQAFLSDDASRDERVQLSQSVVDFHIRSVMCVPLCDTEGKPFGVIQLDTQDRSKKFTQEDLKLLWAVTNQAAIAWENARRHAEALILERQRCVREIAREVQANLWPRHVPQVPGYALFAHHGMPSEVPGGYCRFIALPDHRLAIVLGKVPGNGMSTALLTAQVAAEVPYCFITEANVANAFHKLNEMLREFCIRADLFVPLVAAVLDPGKHVATLVNAGHPSPLLYLAKDRTAFEGVPRDAAAIPLGVQENSPLTSYETPLERGDCLLLYTSRACVADSHPRCFSDREVRKALRDACAAERQRVSDRLAAVVEAHHVVLAGLVRLS